MKRRLATVILLLPIITSCTSPAEINIVTRTTSYQGNIYIGGSVNNPGLYPFSGEDSLADLIEAAGGLKESSDASLVELSFGQEGAPQKIDINRADAWLMEALPGVGAATAKNIVAHREACGPFRCLEDLLRVQGIGESLLVKITPYITVGGR